MRKTNGEAGHFSSVLGTRCRMPAGLPGHRRWAPRRGWVTQVPPSHPGLTKSFGNASPFGQRGKTVRFGEAWGSQGLRQGKGEVAAFPAHLPAGARLALAELEADFYRFPPGREAGAAACRRRTDGRSDTRHRPCARWVSACEGVISSDRSHQVPAALLSLFYPAYCTKSAAAEDHDEITLIFSREKARGRGIWRLQPQRSLRARTPRQAFSPLTASPKPHPETAPKPDRNQLLNKRQLRKKIDF